MARIRVLLAEDSLTVRKRLCQVVAADPELELVGEAEDGRRAIELATSLRPDVITLDMAMPVMTGLAATEYIMAYCPTPILIVSASTNRGELFKTLDALAAGALDVLEKPLGDESDGSWERAFTARLKLLSRIKVITHPRGKLAPRATALLPTARARLEVHGDGRPRLVAIGASTGGPAAVQEILRGLPRDFPLPILLVIHIGLPFGGALADWLDGISSLRVSFAADGEALPEVGRCRVVLAPPDHHLVVERGRLRLTSTAERHSCRPSVDVLFESLARDLGAGTIACLLTGMGRDGASGLLAVRQAGGVTIAQDQESSVVFGMPGEAVQLGAASRILPVSEIAEHLSTLASTGGR